MKTEGQVKHQLKQAIFRHIQRRLQLELQDYPPQSEEAAQVKAQIKAEMREFFQKKARVVALYFPDIAALRWVLGDVDLNDEEFWGE